MPRPVELAIVVGTRPELIKISPLPAAAASHGMRCRLLHTGQHFDDRLDAAFFRELSLPAPELNLGTGRKALVSPVAAMVEQLVRALLRRRPDWVVVQGDTNSTLAGALAAHELRIPLAHLEAGLRCGDRTMPEERNRIVVDALSDLLFAPTGLQREALLAEGHAADCVYVVGNTIADVVAGHRRPQPARGRHAVVTLHRQANVDDPRRLGAWLRALAECAREHAMVLRFLAHPRTLARIAAHQLTLPAELPAMAPIGVAQSLALQQQAAVVLTDSGGLQEEACLLGTPCVTMRANTERQETVAIGANRLCEPDQLVTSVAAALASPRGWANPYGAGDTALRALGILARASA